MRDQEVFLAAERETKKEAGRKREQLIIQWIKEDPDPHLSGALRKWRDDVVLRVIAKRPQSIKLPYLFMVKLHLRTQNVRLLPGNAVSITTTTCMGKEVRILVPAQPTVIIVQSVCSD